MEQLRITAPSFRQATTGAARLARCRSYFHEEGDGLIAALERIAGPEGARRALRLWSDLDRALRWEPRFLDRLGYLRGLLLLEHLHGDWPEMLPDMDALDPGSPLAETCCRQADFIEDLVASATSKLAV